jgi:hypothetical protein
MKSEKLSMDIIEKFSLDSVRGAALIRNYSVNHFWRKELNFLHGYRLAMSYGDINIAHYGFVGWVVAAMYLDDHLTDLHHMTRSVVHEMHEFKARNGLMFLLPTWQAVSSFLYSSSHIHLNLDFRLPFHLFSSFLI